MCVLGVLEVILGVKSKVGFKVVKRTNGPIVGKVPSSWRLTPLQASAFRAIA